MIENMGFRYCKSVKKPLLENAVLWEYLRVFKKEFCKYRFLLQAFSLEYIQITCEGSINLPYDIFELIKVLEAHVLQCLSAMLAVFCGVEALDEGEAEDDALLVLGVGDEPGEVVDDLVVVLAGVGLVDGRVHVLDVDDEGVDEGGNFLQVMARYVEARLHRKLPSLRTLLAKLLDECASQERLASTKADAASCRQEIKVVHLHVRHQQFRVHLLPYAVGFEALGIEAILAMERASVECHERGDALAVYRKAVAVNANERGGD